MDYLKKYYRCLFSLSGYHDFFNGHQRKNKNKPLSCFHCGKLETDLRKDKSKDETQ